MSKKRILLIGGGTASRAIALHLAIALQNKADVITVDDLPSADLPEFDPSPQHPNLPELPRNHRHTVPKTLPSQLQPPQNAHRPRPPLPQTTRPWEYHNHGRRGPRKR